MSPSLTLLFFNTFVERLVFKVYVSYHTHADTDTCTQNNTASFYCSCQLLPCDRQICPRGKAHNVASIHR